MAITYGFYNSLNKDRVYNAEQMSSIFNGIITDGVFSTIGDALMPIAGTGMQVIVKTGKCWFNSTWTLNDALLPLDIEAADVSLTRIDAIIVEINSSIGTRANTIKMLKGTPSANPAKPALANSEHLHQYALGYVTVSAGVTSITADKIEVNVGKSSCPFITSVLQQTNIDDLFNQWNAEFSAWFANVQSQLSGDIATNLQRQIDERVKQIDKASDDDIANGSAGKWVDAYGLKKKANEIKGLVYDIVSKQYGRLVTEGIGVEQLTTLGYENVLDIVFWEDCFVFINGKTVSEDNIIDVYTMDPNTFTTTLQGSIPGRYDLDASLYVGRSRNVQILSSLSSRANSYAFLTKDNGKIKFYNRNDTDFDYDSATLNFAYYLDSSEKRILYKGLTDGNVFVGRFDKYDTNVLYNPKNTDDVFILQYDSNGVASYTEIIKHSVTKNGISNSKKTSKISNPYGDFSAGYFPIFADANYIYAYIIVLCSNNDRYAISKKIIKLSMSSLGPDISNFSKTDFIDIPADAMSHADDFCGNTNLYLGMYNGKHYVYAFSRNINQKPPLLLTINPSDLHIEDIHMLSTTESLLRSYFIGPICQEQANQYRQLNSKYAINLGDKSIISVTDLMSMTNEKMYSFCERSKFCDSALPYVNYFKAKQKQIDKIYKDGGPMRIKFFLPES